MLCYAMLCYVMLYYIMLYYVMCYVMLLHKRRNCSKESTVSVVTGQEVEVET